MTEKPDKFPDWCMDKEENKKEYPPSKLTDGWDIGEIPPREWENYFKHLVGKWTHYFDEQISRISTVGVPIGVALPTFPSLGGYRCSALNFADEFGFVLCNGQKIEDPSSRMFGKTIPNLNGNLFLKGSSEDNVQGGNKNHEIDIDHTHNYSHTHEIGAFEVSTESLGKLVQYFILKPDSKNEATWNPTLSFTGSTDSAGPGSTLRLTNKEQINFSKIYSSGVSGSAVNGFLDNAETAGITNKTLTNIEPENISTIYIMRIK